MVKIFFGETRKFQWQKMTKKQNMAQKQLKY
jgi:hypothetical protein